MNSQTNFFFGKKEKTKIYITFYLVLTFLLVYFVLILVYYFSIGIFVLLFLFFLSIKRTSHLKLWLKRLERRGKVKTAHTQTTFKNNISTFSFEFNLYHCISLPNLHFTPLSLFLFWLLYEKFLILALFCFLSLSLPPFFEIRFRFMLVLILNFLFSHFFLFCCLHSSPAIFHRFLLFHFVSFNSFRCEYFHLLFCFVV